MFTPDQFRVNEAWIVVRVNDTFLFVKDEPYDIYVLMDAASGYVLGDALSMVTDEGPRESDINALFTKAWKAKNQWAEQLILTDHSNVWDGFRRQAEQNGLAITVIPLCDLEPIVAPLKESFSSFILSA